MIYERFTDLSINRLLSDTLRSRQSGRVDGFYCNVTGDDKDEVHLHFVGRNDECNE